VFVDPVPDPGTFELMYAKSAYHDLHYADADHSHYTASAKLLRKFLPTDAVVLDYGCGLGAFLKALEAETFTAIGVEFDANAAKFAAEDTGCKTFSTANFWATNEKPPYDAIHLGDVLEHLPDPGETLRGLLAFLKPGGLLFAEGPLENNPSPVYWAARMFGAAKGHLNPNFVGSAPPLHLFRVDAQQQLAFFTRVEPRLQQLHWDVHETGWPYVRGSALKRIIAGAALFLGGRRMMDTTFGNRFRGVFRLPPERDARKEIRP
jgi:SAM-dependent methyltransferase